MAVPCPPCAIVLCEQNPVMRSPQTLSEADRRIVASWAADCAERVLGLFEAEAPGDSRPRDAIARTRAFARGELGVADQIRRRFLAGGAGRVVPPAAAAAARAAGQAAAIPHMGAHALGAAAYAAKAAGLAAPEESRAVAEEIRWQLDSMSAAVRAALLQLPPVGENPSGPLGPGLLASGLLGTIIREFQVLLAQSGRSSSASSSSAATFGSGLRSRSRPASTSSRAWSRSSALKIGRKSAATIPCWSLRTWPSVSRRKWTVQRCQGQSRVCAIAALRPAWASETTSCTPRRPRLTRPRRKLRQNASVSHSPTSRPITSR